MKFVGSKYLKNISFGFENASYLCFQSMSMISIFVLADISVKILQKLQGRSIPGSFDWFENKSNVNDPGLGLCTFLPRTLPVVVGSGSFCSSNIVYVTQKIIYFIISKKKIWIRLYKKTCNLILKIEALVEGLDSCIFMMACPIPERGQYQCFVFKVKLHFFFDTSIS